MDRKGVAGIAAIILLFMGAIVALSLLPQISEDQTTLTGTVQANNVTYTMAASGSSIDLTGQEYISGMIVTNATSGATVPATNYTVSEGVSTTTGQKTILLTTNPSTYASQSVNVSYLYGEDGYADSAGARGVAGLIILTSAIGLLGFVVYYAAKQSGYLN